jgi:ABC-type uncharacterized transport system permease subunit
VSVTIASLEFGTEHRPVPRPWLRFFVPALSIAFGSVVGAVILLITGQNPTEAYIEMFKGGFIGKSALVGTLVLATPLILAALAAAVAFRMRIWNIGAEGQLIVGAIGASGTGLYLGDRVTGPVAIALMLIAGSACGALWAGLAAIPRAYFNTDEVISTLMLNFVALSLMNYLIFSTVSYWRDAERVAFPAGRFIGSDLFLPRVWGRLHIGLFLAMSVAAILWWALRSTRWGFEVTVTGDSPRAAHYAGMRVKRKIVSLLLVSGALAGLGGAIEVGGVLHNLDARALSVGVGFTGIVVAAIARLSPLGIIPVAVLVASFTNAGPGLQSIGIPSEVVLLLEGVLFLSVVGGEWFLRNRIRVGRLQPVAEPQTEAGPA